MSRTAPRLSRFSEGDVTVPDVEVFQLGRHRGRHYTSKDLDVIVSNFNRYSTGPRALLEPPLVIGHEEVQTLTENTGIPALGWVTRLYRRGRSLFATFSHVPRQIARLIRAGRYRHVSAEIYDDPPEGVPGRGKMLRRVAMLGGDLPQIKSIADIPLPVEHSEQKTVYVPVRLTPDHATRLPAGSWAVFSEVSPMDRSALIEALSQHGIDPAMITDEVPDELLMAIVQAMGEVSESPEATEQPAEEPVEHAEEVEHNEPDGDEPPMHPHDAEGATKLMEHAKKYFEKHCGQMAEVGEMGDLGVLKKKPGGMAKMSELESLIEKILTTKVQASLAEVQKFHEQQLAGQKKATVDTILDELVKTGRVPPVERESERQGLLLLDNQTVHKFAERGKVLSLTAFEQRVKQLRARPSLFAERFKADTQPGAEDSEIQKLEQHYETFSESFKSLRTSKEEFLSAFKKLRERAPDTTAEKFVNGKL
jgi:hypothetical protein